ncbi:hypothetical protein C2G38_2232430 [Gigaspora rosea]|uniref:Uncharacterized protein n=1 Tax=Gigaspora rosea TaxID=44941 RepID=A0A397TRY6_9GLOM|nr:hypothetical protein C2G38_2232430 [Gigaspora rosea]
MPMGVRKARKYLLFRYNDKNIAALIKEYNYFSQSPKIVKSSKDNIPLAANATAGYTLDMFFNELPELRPAFYFPDDRCGPDIIFFVEFENNATVPVFVQVKLHYSIHTIAEALSTIYPKMFYKDKNGKIFQEETTKPIVNKIIKQCEEFGSIESPKIVKSSKDNIPLAANATAGYTLDMFFNELPELRPAFYFPDDRCGPDIIFFVEFENNATVPVFVQVKLHYSIHTIAEALSTIYPKMFYKDKNGKIFQEETTKPIVNKIIKQCEEFGSIGILVAYPANLCQESFVTNNHSYNLRNRSSQQQLIRIINYKNAAEVF